MENELTRDEICFLEVLNETQGPFCVMKICNATSYPIGLVHDLTREMSQKGYINNGGITDLGRKMLEPYCARRAIFLASGYGSRLRPINHKYCQTFGSC